MPDERHNASNDETPSPAGDEKRGNAPDTAQGGRERAPHHEPIPLEVEEEAEEQAEGDPCPKCGAPMKADQLVCMRCGYNLRELTVAKTKVIKTPAEVEEADQDAADKRPLVRPFWFDPWLPAAIAAVSGLVLIIGYLAGAMGLYPEIAAAAAEAAAAGREIPAPTLGTRAVAVLQFLVLAALWTGCGMAGLFLLAQIVGRAFGDLAPAALRMLAIVTAMRIVAFINLANPTWERLVEFVLQAAVFYALTLALFRLSPRNAGIVSFMALIAFFALWLSASAITWVTYT